MDTEKTIHSHRTIRKFQNREIPKDQLDKILQAASRASSSGNMQTYSIIVTQDPEMKKQLYKPHFEQSMILEAPVFLTFCADFHRMKIWLEASDATNNFDNYFSFMVATIDATLASQNAALMAESLGLGICYMGTTLASSDEIASILDLPEQVIPVVGFALGYPAEDPAPRYRLDQMAIVHQEKYQKKSKDQIQNLYAEKEVEGMRRYQDYPELKEKIQAQKINNLAQVYTKLKYTRQSHQEYSQRLIRLLAEKQFMNNS